MKNDSMIETICDEIWPNVLISSRMRMCRVWTDIKYIHRRTDDSSLELFSFIQNHLWAFINKTHWAYSQSIIVNSHMIWIGFQPWETDIQILGDFDSPRPELLHEWVICMKASTGLSGSVLGKVPSRFQDEKHIFWENYVGFSCTARAVPNRTWN